MYVIESRHFKDEHLNTILSVSSERVLIQKNDEDDVILEEWFIPFIKISKLETNFKLSKNILSFIKRSSCIFISKNFIETHEAKIFYDQEEIMCWDTFTMDTPTCVCTSLPCLEHLESETVILRVSCNKLIVEDHDEKIEYNFENIKTFQEGSVSLVTYFLQKVFEENKGSTCKMYIEKDNPLCLEFCDGHRVFVAPTL